MAKLAKGNNPPKNLLLEISPGNQHIIFYQVIEWVAAWGLSLALHLVT